MPETHNDESCNGFGQAMNNCDFFLPALTRSVGYVARLVHGLLIAQIDIGAQLERVKSV